MLKFLLLMVSFSLFCLEANNLSGKIKQKTDFLNSIKEELQKEDKDDFERNKKITDCLECIESVKARLDLIKSELIKSKKDKSLLNELIEEFNSKMKDLKDKYEFLKFVQEKDSDNESFSDNSSLSISAITYLTPHTRKKLIKKSQKLSEVDFDPIQAEELAVPKTVPSCKENYTFPKD